MIAVGKIGGLYGADGEVSLTLFDDFPRDFNIEEPVWVSIDSLRVPLYFETLQRRGVRGATAVFADIDTEARAAELVGLEFFLKSSGEDSVHEDLIGWEADLGDGITGIVSDFIHGANPLFEIEVFGEPLFIPAGLAVEVDEAAHCIIFDIPEGLLELN